MLLTTEQWPDLSADNTMLISGASLPLLVWAPQENPSDGEDTEAGERALMLLFFIMSAGSLEFASISVTLLYSTSAVETGVTYLW